MRPNDLHIDISFLRPRERPGCTGRAARRKASRRHLGGPPVAVPATLAPWIKAKQERLLLAILKGAPCTFGGSALIGLPFEAGTGPMVAFAPLAIGPEIEASGAIEVMSLPALELAVETGGVQLAAAESLHP